MVSNCCGADVMESGLCSNCGEHCEQINDDELDFKEVEDENCT